MKSKKITAIYSILFISIFVFLIKDCISLKNEYSKDNPEIVHTLMNNKLLTQNVHLTGMIFRLNKGYYYDVHEMLVNNVFAKNLTGYQSAIDVGAANGFHLLQMGNYTKGKVLGFEPNEDFYNNLKVAAAREENTSVENVAICDKEGTATFYLYTNNYLESGLSPRRELMALKKDNGKLEEIPCKVKTLDNYIDKLPDVGYIKIDVEGAELNVLHGGKKLIAKYRPIITAEIQNDVEYFGHKRSEAFEFAKENDYILCDIFGNPFYTQEDWDKYGNSTFDYIFIPKEKYDKTVENLKK